MKKVLKCLCLSLFALIIGIGSFLIPKYYKKQSLIASADSSYSPIEFNSSNFFLHSRYSNSSVNYTSNFSSYTLDADINFSYRLNFSFNGSRYLISPYFLIGSTAYSLYTPMFYNLVAANGANNSYITNDYNIKSSAVTDNGYLGTRYYGVVCLMDYYYQGNPYSSTSVYKSFYSVGDQMIIPSGVIVSLEIGMKDDLSSIGYVSNSTFSDNYNFITTRLNTNYYYFCFTDSVGFRYIFFIPASSSSFLYEYSYRFYILNSGYFSNDETYNLGYRNGLADNQQNIYDNGYSAGKAAGRVEGYYEGLAEDTNYTFYGLIGAVVDVPVQTFMGLLNYELFGVNIAGFLLGLLSLGLILLIIKLILGGR